MMELVKRQPRALRLASAVLKDDREIVLEAVKQHWDCLRTPGCAEGRPRDRGGQAVRGCAVLSLAALQDDREFMLEAVKQDWKALDYASPRCRTTARSCWRPLSRTGMRCTSHRPG